MEMTGTPLSYLSVARPLDLNYTELFIIPKHCDALSISRFGAQVGIWPKAIEEAFPCSVRISRRRDRFRLLPYFVRPTKEDKSRPALVTAWSFDRIPFAYSSSRAASIPSWTPSGIG